ncbi:two-component system response regulator NarL [Vibrio sp. MEBiC08052]|uniref:two-component system response regulator NarL n=1 Tax=Vibrio sp. MEBiC08052 TaxID=1761910 RepID=UPI0007406D4F|nr:two-component system response regulator NarL [Vibrio sp. MEBiC08052]KUI99649.1 DNA-binding response regulator in two-component regulatory system with NarX (or NarQ) [Vibrio sp. MEBiC08052]
MHPTHITNATTSVSPATVMLVDDHPMLRQGLKQLLQLNPQIEVVKECNNGQQAVKLALDDEPDVILLDINMPDIDGIQTLKLLRDNDITSRIIIFTVSNYEEDLVRAIQAGADGYLLKDMEAEDLLHAIEQVCLGELVVSPKLANLLAKQLRNSPHQAQREIDTLTTRERDVLKLLAQSLPNKLIARKLNIAETTVKVHVKHILKKLQLRSRVEAAVWVHQQGIDQ